MFKTQRLIVFLSGIILISFSSFYFKTEENAIEEEPVVPAKTAAKDTIFVILNRTEMNAQVYAIALKGIKSIQDSLHHTIRYLAVVDFSLPSTSKRFYLIDLKDTTQVCSEYVCHGKHSGDNYATSFSNIGNSNKSSLGFYKLSESYMGQHGLSIRMDGLDLGYNDKARERAIVMHAADYADTTVIKTLGRLGRSLGCPALPKHTFNRIAPELPNNTIIFNYYPDEDYLKKSVWLR